MSADPIIDQSDRPELEPSEFFELLGRRINGKMHTGLVARVASFDAARRTVDAKPVFAQRYSNGDRVPMPLLVGVPVAFPGGAGFELTHPLEAGDYVFVSFAERSLDEWQRRGGADLEPADLRRFDLSDGVAVAMLEPPSLAPAVDAENMVIGEREVGGMKITIYADGKVTIGAGAVELLDQITTLLDALELFFAATSGATIEPTLGPAANVTRPIVDAVNTAIKSIKGP